MKSFDNRLQHDLFPKKPAAFDRMVEDQLHTVCGRSESKQNVMRFTDADGDTQPQRKKTGVFGRVWTVAVAAVLVISLLAVGTIFALARRTKSGSVSTELSEGTVEPVWSQKTDVILLSAYTDLKTGDAYSDYVALREANGIPAYSEETFFWLNELESTMTYLDLNGNTLDFETVFTVPQRLRDSLSESPINGDAYTVVMQADAPVFVLDDTEGMPGENNYTSYAAQYFYTDVYAVGNADPWQLAVAQQYELRDDFLDLIAKGKTLMIRSTYSVYDRSLLDLTCDDADAAALNRNCALVGVVEQTIEVDLPKLTAVEAEYRTELALSGTHTLTVMQEEADGSVILSNKKLNFDGLVLNEAVQYRATGLYVTLSVKDLPEGWREQDGTMLLLHPSNWVAENSFGIFAGLRLGEQTPPVAARVPWACPKDTVTFVFPVTADDARLQQYGAELILYLKAEGNSDAQEICRAALQPPIAGQTTNQPSGTDACGTFAAQLPTPAVTPAPAAQKTVHVSTVEELLTAIAPHTEIVLTAGVYDLGMDAEQMTEANPYCSFATRYTDDGDRFFKITGVDGLCIRAEEGAECVLTASHKNACEAVFAAEACTGFVLSGITVCGNAENDILLLQCADARLNGCMLGVDGDSAVSGTPIGIGIDDCASVTVSDCRMENCASAVSAMNSKSITLSECEIAGCLDAAWMYNVENVLFAGCTIHGCRNEDTVSDEGEQGDASYLFSIDGSSNSVLFATFEDCDIYNNKSTFFFSADGIDEVTLSGLKIHDNGFARLFEFEATSDLAGRYVIKNCDVDRNKIGTFLFCGQPDAKTVLSGTSIADNEMDTVFFGGDVTVSGCAFLSPEITRWIGSHESYPDLKTYIHDADGNELSEAELWAMELKRDNS